MSIETRTIDDLSSNRRFYLGNEFLDRADVLEICSLLDLDLEEQQDREAAEELLDHLVNTYESQSSILLYRRIAVPDVGAFVAGIDAPEAWLGESWSSSMQTECVMHAGVEGEAEILLVGSVDAKRVDWHRTWMQNLSWPLEREIVFDGPISLEMVVVPGGESVPFDGRLLATARPEPTSRPTP